MAKTPGTGIAIGTHFSPRFKRPLDDRFTFDTINEMINFTSAALYDGIETYNKETKKRYRWSSSNPQTALGKWVEIKDTITNYNNLENLPSIEGITISGSKDADDYNLQRKLSFDNAPTNDSSNPVTSEGIFNALEVKANVDDVYIKTEADDTFVKQEKLGVADGVATLDQSGKVPASQLNITAFTPKGMWDASTNTPQLQDGVGTLGDTYICSVAGTANFGSGEITFSEGDQVIYMNDVWNRSINSNAVDSVNGKTGAVVLTKDDIELDQVDNTSDLDKPISTATQEALDLKSDIIQYSTLPEASIDNFDKVIQYVGTSTAEYTKGYFYVCVEKNGTYEWQPKTVQAGGAGGAGTLEKKIVANTEVGGITVGSTFEEGSSITDLLYSMLVKFIYQKVTLDISCAALVKKGTVINPVTMTANITKGDNPIVDAVYKVNGTVVDTKNETTDPTIIDGGSYTFEYTEDVITDTTFEVTVRDNPTFNVRSASKSVKFINPFYYGISDVNTLVDFAGLTEKLVEKSKQEFAFTADGQYLVFAYDSTYGDVASIIDQNNFDNTSSFTKSTLEVEGETYNVYVSNDTTVCTNFKYTISF